MAEISILIIDDEAPNRNLLKDLVLKLQPHFTFAGEADSVDDAFRKINRLKPDLIFLDIKMPGENGFDLLKRFDPAPFEVVFITGFDEYAIQAFECHALDYILKPIDTYKFARAMEKVRLRFENRLSNLANLKNILCSYLSGEAIITKLPVHHKNQVVLLDMNELAFIKADDGCTTFYTMGGEEYLSSKKLSEFEFIIGRFPHFVHINRGAYVNLNYIKSYSKGADCFIVLKNDAVFEVSRRKRSQVLALLHRY